VARTDQRLSRGTPIIAFERLPAFPITVPSGPSHPVKRPGEWARSGQLPASLPSIGAHTSPMFNCVPMTMSWARCAHRSKDFQHGALLHFSPRDRRGPSVEKEMEQLRSAVGAV
jgi:hypothetical protein